MRPKERREGGEQDLFRARLDQIIDLDHALVRLARAIDWRFLEEKLGAVYTDEPGRGPRGETDMQSKYPNVCVALVGEDENAFAILARVQRALREAGVPTAEVKAFTVEACSGDYYHLLETVLRTVETT